MMPLAVDEQDTPASITPPPPPTVVLRGHLFSQQQSSEFIFKVLLIGSSGVGKTTFIRRLTGDDDTTPIAPTVGIDYRCHSCQVSADGQSIRLQLWDTAGQERYRSLAQRPAQAFYRGAIGFIVMFDVTSADSFVDLHYWLTQIEQHAWSSRSVVIVGNKKDRAVRSTVGSREALEFARRNRCAYVETSARNGINVAETIELLVGDMMANVERLGLEWYGGGTPMPSIEEPEAKRKRCCL